MDFIVHAMPARPPKIQAHIETDLSNIDESLEAVGSSRRQPYPVPASVVAVQPHHTMSRHWARLPGLADLSDELADKVFSIGRKLAVALRQTSLRCEGVNLFYAAGEAAFQEVFHAHLHVFLRFADDGFVIDARWGTNPSRGLLNDRDGRPRPMTAVDSAGPAADQTTTTNVRAPIAARRISR